MLIHLSFEKNNFDDNYSLISNRIYHVLDLCSFRKDDRSCVKWRRRFWCRINIIYTGNCIAKFCSARDLRKRESTIEKIYMTSKWINCLIVTFQDGGIIIPSSEDVFLSAKEDCTKYTYIHSLRFLTCSSNNSQQGRWRLGWTRTNTPCKMSETINVLRSTLYTALCTCIFLSTCLYTEQDLFIRKRLRRSERCDKSYLLTYCT